MPYIQPIKSMDTYPGYNALRKCHHEGKDYVILLRDADTRLAVMAPHGGGIEPGTVDVADAVAAGDFTFYAFKGLMKSGNRVLHLGSTRFDEPVGLSVADKADLVLTIHGCRGTTAEILIGGKLGALKESLRQSLTLAGFQARMSAQPGLRGMDPENICNRFAPRGGVQLELTRELREAMFHHLENRSFRGKTPLFFDFVQAVRRPLLEQLDKLPAQHQFE